MTASIDPGGSKAVRRRNYVAEYARRIARGELHGLSRSQARGHPRVGEPAVAANAGAGVYDRRLEEGVKRLRKGGSVTKVARSLGVAPERLRRYAYQTGVVEKQRGRLVVRDDHRPRVVPLLSRGRRVTVMVPGFAEAAKAGHYMGAVGRFLESNDPAALEPFINDGVTSVAGRHHPFETRPNVLYRLTASPSEPYEQIYKITA